MEDTNTGYCKICDTRYNNKNTQYSLHNMKKKQKRNKQMKN